MMEFFCLTPLPGSEDHQILYGKGVAMDPDMNKYDTEHPVTAHSKMTQTEWEEIPRRMGHLLYAGTSGTHHAPGGRDRHQSKLARRSPSAFFPIHRDRECPPAAGRYLSAEISRDRRRLLRSSQCGPSIPVCGIRPPSSCKLCEPRHLFALAKTIKADPRRRPIWTRPCRRPSKTTESLDLFNQSDAARHAVQHERHVRELTAAAN